MKQPVRHRQRLALERCSPPSRGGSIEAASWVPFPATGSGVPLHPGGAQLKHLLTLDIGAVWLVFPPIQGGLN